MKFKHQKQVDKKWVEQYLVQKTLELSLYSGVEVIYKMEYIALYPNIILKEVQFFIDGSE